MQPEAFDYGEYEKFYADARVQRVLKTIDRLAHKMNIQYQIIGGLAAYMYRKNPPQDGPDIDIMILTKGRCEAFAKALYSASDKFRRAQWDVDGDDCFVTMIYDGEIQVDILTQTDKQNYRKPPRVSEMDLEPVEPLIVEKLVRGSVDDILVAIDLLAFMDYDKTLLSQIAREYLATGMLRQAEWAAHRWAAGRLTKAVLKNVAERISKNG